MKGWQAIYSEGLAALDAAGPAASRLPGPARDLVLRDAERRPGGRRARRHRLPAHARSSCTGRPSTAATGTSSRWRYTNYDGDVQPRGWTREEIERGPETGAPRADAGDSPLPLERLSALAPLGASAEVAHGILERSGGTLSGDPAELGPSSEWVERRSARCRGDAVVIGSGAAGSVAAWELARKGWSVTVLERGRNMRPGFGKRPSGKLGTRYGSDEIKSGRQLRVPRSAARALHGADQGRGGGRRRALGDRARSGQLGAAVGGTTLHYNAKFPRFWKQDFAQLSDLGPGGGRRRSPTGRSPTRTSRRSTTGSSGGSASRGTGPDAGADPASSRRGGASSRWARTRCRTSAALLAEGARRSGYTAYPQPAAVNSETLQGPAGVQLVRALLGVRLPDQRPRGRARLVAEPGGADRPRPRDRRARSSTGSRPRRTAAGRPRVRYVDAAGPAGGRSSGDIVVVAGSPINTARLLLMSRSAAHPKGLGNRSDQVGRNMMFHNFTLAAAVFGERHPPDCAQSNSLQLDDLVGPFTGPEVSALGVPYVKGGLVQVGGALPLMTEATTYAGFTG